MKITYLEAKDSCLMNLPMGKKFKTGMIETRLIKNLECHVFKSGGYVASLSNRQYAELMEHKIAESDAIDGGEIASPDTTESSNDDEAEDKGPKKRGRKKKELVNE
jgi:uncharacterized protein (UPF0179 family)